MERGVCNRARGGFMKSGWMVKGNVKEADELRAVAFLDHIPGTAEGQWDVSEEQDGSVMAWTADVDGELVLYIVSEGGVKASGNCSWMFSECENLEEIYFGQNFDTSAAVNMSGMFYRCRSLTWLDLAGINTSKVENMSSMFEDCSELCELDLSEFDTSSVTDMSSMFEGCHSLCELNIRGFDTSQVTDMDFMFEECFSLEELDLRSFDTSKVIHMRAMFWDCSGLEKLDVSSFDTSRTESVAWMFYGCESLEKLPCEHFDLSNVEDCRDMLARTRWEPWTDPYSGKLILPTGQPRQKC